MINTSVLMGRLTADPELRTTKNGTNYAKFTLAVERSFQKQGEEKQTDFIYVTTWQKTAEFVTRYFFKGSMIAVEGSIQTGNYTDKDGSKRNTFEVVANRVSFCGSKNESKAPASNSYSNDFDEIPTDDDLPF